MINKPLYIKALFLAGVHQGGVGLTGHGLLEFPPNFPKKKHTGKSPDVSQQRSRVSHHFANSPGFLKSRAVDDPLIIYGIFIAKWLDLLWLFF